MRTSTTYMSFPSGKALHINAVFAYALSLECVACDFIPARNLQIQCVFLRSRFAFSRAAGKIDRFKISTMVLLYISAILFFN